MPGPLDFSLDPTMADVLPPAQTTLPQAPQAPPVVGQDPRQQLLNIAALGALLGAGPRSGFGVGAGQGLLQQQHGMQQLVDQHAAVVRQQQQQLAQAQQQQVEANVQRQRQLQSALMTITQRVQTLPDKDTYDQEIEGYANTLKAAGYRLDSNWLRQAVPYVAPTAEKQAGRMLEAFFKNPANAQMIKEHPDQLAKAAVSFDVDGDGIPENVPLLRLSQIAKMPFGVDEHGQMLNYAKGTTLDDKANADTIYADLKAKAQADGKDVTNPDVTMPLREQAIKLATGDKAKGSAVGSFEDYLTRYASEKSLTPDRLNTRQIEDARKRYNQADDRGLNLSGMNALYAATDPRAIAAQIRAGNMPPDISQYGRPVQGAIASMLAQPGPQGEKPFNLARAQREWKAQLNLNRTMNGSQQVRLDESIRSGLAMYDKVDEIADQWDGLGLGPLSRANLAAARNGLKGKKAQSIAVQLSGQIGQLTSDIATIEQGGLTPTNESRAVAEKSMQDWWGRGTIRDMTAQGRYNMQIRHLARNTQETMTPGNGVSMAPALPATPAPSPGADPALDAAAAILRNRGRSNP